MTDQQIEVRIDDELDVAYIRLSKAKVHRTVEMTDEVNVDLDEFRVVVGVEVLSLDATIPFTRMHEELHVHSDVIETLRKIQPSVAASIRLTQGADGTARAVKRQEARTSAL